MKRIYLIPFILFYVQSASSEDINPLSDLYSRTYHISVKDNYLFASSTVGLTVYKMEEKKLVQISALMFENSGTSSIIENNNLYLFTGNSGVYKIDIADPQRLVIKKNVRLLGSAINGDIYKNNLIVALGSTGFAILNKESLELIKYIETSSYCSYVKLFNSMLFVSTEDGTLSVYEFKGNNLVLKHKIALTKRIRDMTLSGDLIFAANDTDGIAILKKEKKGLLKKLEYDTPDTARGVTIYKDYLFVADGNTGIVIFKINPDNSLRFIKNYDTGYSANKILVKDDLAIISNDAMGVMVINVNDLIF